MISRRSVLRLAAGAIAAPLVSWASVPPGSSFEGRKVLAHLLDLARKHRWHDFPIGALVGDVGLALTGVPYVGGTLETDDNVEVCIVSLTRLDCVTYYEVCLGFARMLKATNPRTLDEAERAMLAQVRSMRYRGGRQDGYLSRLHYTSDWLFENDRRRTVNLFTRSLPGAVRMDKPLDYMSTHPSAYRQLRAHPEWVPLLGDLEKEWAARRPWYIPKEEVPVVESMLDTGDIIGIATSAAGLDTSHTGICYRDADSCLRILHASSTHHKVELGPRLADYLMAVKKDIGIMVAQPLEPS